MGRLILVPRSLCRNTAPLDNFSSQGSQFKLLIAGNPQASDEMVDLSAFERRSVARLVDAQHHI